MLFARSVVKIVRRGRSVTACGDFVVFVTFVVKIVD